MNYGHHHSAATDAIAWLVTHKPDIPERDVPAVLTCRAAVIGAHLERLERAVRGSDAPGELFGSRQHRRDPAALARVAPVALYHQLEEYPRLDDRQVALTDVLCMDGLTAYTQAWVEAARHSVLTTEEVATDTGWWADAAKSWQVVADAADAADAITVIDSRLEESGKVFSREWREDLDRHRTGTRFLARHVGFLARSGELDPATDSIERRASRTEPVPVKDLADIVRAANVTERLITDGSLSVAGLRRFALMQSDISHACAGLVTDDRFDSLQQTFEQREIRFRQLAGSTVRVASIGPSQDGPLLMQTQEIGRTLLQAQRSSRAVSLGVLAEYDALQPHVSRALAQATQRSFSTGRYLVVDDEDVALQWRRVERQEVAPAVLAARQVAGVSTEHDLDLLFAVEHLAGSDLSASGWEARRQVGQEGRSSSDAAGRTATGAGPSAPSRRRLQSMLDQQPFQRPTIPNRRPSRSL